MEGEKRCRRIEDERRRGEERRKVEEGIEEWRGDQEDGRGGKD